MPDPLLYSQAMLTAALVSAIFMLMVTGRRSANMTRLNTACVLGFGLGAAAGCWVLSLRLAWPPVNGLDRLLTIVIPAVLCIELIGELPRAPHGMAWFLRMSLAVAAPRILLHDSTYLSGEFALWHAGTLIAVCGVVLASVWVLLSWLSQRSCGISIPTALVMSTLCAGLTVMMAGYVKGGAAAFLLATAMLAVTVVVRLMTKQLAPAIIGIGVVNLFGILFIGRFFGRLSTGCALAIFLAPLLCWVTEIPWLRQQKPWLTTPLRLALVAIPLGMVLAWAKRDFDRNTAPLLGETHVHGVSSL